MARERILVVDDEEDVRDIVRITLEAEQYEVIEASDGEEALQMIRKRTPHLVILDYKIPKLDGAAVCKTLKKDVLLQHLPIIMLTSRGELIDKVKGIDAGADDYMVKPFEPKELVARVRMILRRTSRALDANPLTKLPGNVSILEELEACLVKGGPLAVCYLDLDKFKAFNDTYGFERGDETIKETARIIIKSIQANGNADDFIGHGGGDDFVMVTTPDKAEVICKQIINDFDSVAPSFYDTVDRNRGYIEGKDRQGKTTKFPLISVSIGVVTNEKRPFTHVAEINETGAELKEFAKSKQFSNYVRDRR